MLFGLIIESPKYKTIIDFLLLFLLLHRLIYPILLDIYYLLDDITVNNKY